jgi:hypothetical protein
VVLGCQVPTHRPQLLPELALLLGGHSNFRDGDRVAAHLARQLHRVTGMLLQSPEALVTDVVDLAAADEYVFGLVVFRASQGAVAIGHLAAMLGLRSKARLPNSELQPDVRVLEIWVPVRRDPPKKIAHHPILVERAMCPHRPRRCNYDGKANHASEADEHHVEIIAWKLGRPTPPSQVS